MYIKDINISISENFIFINNLIEKNKILSPKLIYGCINKLVYSKLNDIII